MDNNGPAQPTPADEGRRRALVEALETNERRFHALAFGILGDHHAAEDAVQEASLRALRALDGFRADASMTTWLQRIISNACFDELRRRRLRPTAVDMTDGASDVGPVMADFAEATVAGSDLDRALAELPVSQRRALILTDVWGLGYEDAGALLGVPKGTVGSRVYRGRRSIREALALGPGAGPRRPSFGEAA